MSVVNINNKGEWEKKLEEAGDKPVRIILFLSFFVLNDKVFVDFKAVWCGPCKMISPIFHKLAEEYKDKAIFLQVDVDDVSDVAQQVGIEAMPTFHVYKQKAKVDELVGANPSKLSELVKKHAA